MASLSLALSETKSDGYHKEEVRYSRSDQGAHRHRVIDEAACIVNDLLHKEIKQNKCHSCLCPDLLNIDDYLEGVNPLLLQFIQGATKAVQNKEYDT